MRSGKIIVIFISYFQLVQLQWEKKQNTGILTTWAPLRRAIVIINSIMKIVTFE